MSRSFKVVVGRKDSHLYALGLGPEAQALGEFLFNPAQEARFVENFKQLVSERRILWICTKSESASESEISELLTKLRSRLHREEQILSLLSSAPETKAFQTPPNKIFWIHESSAPFEIRFATQFAATLAPLLTTQAQVETARPPREKLLLHVCCGPDAAGVVDQLQENFDLVTFWYDPNIQPLDEYERRLDAFVKVAELKKVPYIIGEYDADRFLNTIRGLEASPEQGAKCSLCYDLRLERAALEAQKNSCSVYSTTLAISPHKVQEKLRKFGEAQALKYGVSYYARNFMKDEGFKKSVYFTEEHNIYRQDYCGCWFSLHEGGPDARSKAQKWGLEPKALQSGKWELPKLMIDA